MGHIRLGRLPKSRDWDAVVALLDREPDEIPGVAARVLAASADELQRDSTIRSASRAFLILLQIAQASDQGRVVDALRGMGLEVIPSSSVLSTIAGIGDRLRRETPAGSDDNYADYASLALRRALLETAGVQGPSLFASTVSELEAGFARTRGGARFGLVTRRFFGDYLARALHGAVDRELSKHVGTDRSFANVAESRAFSEALDGYARETAVIVQRFATEWYAKHAWQQREELGPRDARAFTAVALKKLRSDLALAGDTA
jgi:hypothetical protein